MSTKGTIFLTQDNEHWYEDCNGRYYEDTKTERCIVLEIGSDHRVEQDEDGTRIIIEEDTALYNAISEMRLPVGSKQVFILGGDTEVDLDSMIGEVKRELK